MTIVTRLQECCVLMRRTYSHSWIAVIIKRYSIFFMKSLRACHIILSMMNTIVTSMTCIVQTSYVI